MLVESSLVITVLFFLPFTKTVMNLLGEGETYYRILWLLPMAVVIAYAGIRLFGKHYRIGFVLLTLVLVLTGKSVYDSPYLSKAQNRYHIPNSVIAICNEIMPAEEEERVWAVFPAGADLLCTAVYIGGADALRAGNAGGVLGSGTGTHIRFMRLCGRIRLIWMRFRRF